jgi:hypothetical protein
LFSGVCSQHLLKTVSLPSLIFNPSIPSHQTRFTLYFISWSRGFGWKYWYILSELTLKSFSFRNNLVFFLITCNFLYVRRAREASCFEWRVDLGGQSPCFWVGIANTPRWLTENRGTWTDRQCVHPQFIEARLDRSPWSFIARLLVMVNSLLMYVQMHSLCSLDLGILSSRRAKR